MEGEAVRRPVVVRPSVWTQVFNVTLGVMGVAFTGVLAVAALNDSGPALAGLFLTPGVFLVFVSYRGLSAAVVADSRGLLVRNMHGTSRFAWHEVEGFRLGGAVTSFSRGLVVLLRDGEMLTMGPTVRAWGSESHTRMLADLRAWQCPPRDEWCPPSPFDQTGTHPPPA